MIPEKLVERLIELGENPEDVYNSRTRKAYLGPGNDKVPWFPDASYDGDGYVFDPISAVPVIALEPKPNEKILDMCAAPGTKTILISHLMGNSGNIVANDVSRNRLMRLKSNIEKYKINAEITTMSGRIISDKFDKILVDAPCSGEGIVNKKDKLFSVWSERRISFLSKKQKKLISNAFRILNENGILVYSTCTFAPEENEEVIQYILDKNDNAKLDSIDVDAGHSAGLREWRSMKFADSMRRCMRIYPRHNSTSGFFVAKIRKQA